MSRILVGWVVLLGLACGRDRPGPDRLDRAIVMNDVGEVRRLLAAGADPRGVDPGGFGEAMLAVAVNYDDSGEIVEALLDHGADPHMHSRLGLTPLGMAAGGDRVGAIVALLDHGADVDHRERWTATPLHAAARSGSLRAATLLLDRGAEIDARIDEGGGVGPTPLHLAAQEGHVEMVRLLVARGADPLARDENGRTPAELASEAAARDARDVAVRDAIDRYLRARR